MQSDERHDLKVLIATRNKHKVEEISSILGDRFEFLTLADVPGAPVPVEDAPDFAGNATKKAVVLANWLCAQGNPCGAGYVLADDSGLEVDALRGAPGVHSARFAALDTGAPGNSADADNNAKLLRLLAGLPLEKRAARFRCVIAVTPVPDVRPISHSPACEANEAELSTSLFTGKCEGRILISPRGAGGFGYDPLFLPEGHECSFAELGDELKNQISHRSEALRGLAQTLAAGAR